MKNNMSRRQFLKTGGLALAAMTFRPASVFSSSGTLNQRYVSLRPVTGKRNFVSKAFGLQQLIKLYLEWLSKQETIEEGNDK